MSNTTSTSLSSWVTRYATYRNPMQLKPVSQRLLQRLEKLRKRKPLKYCRLCDCYKPNSKRYWSEAHKVCRHCLYHRY